MRVPSVGSGGEIRTRPCSALHARRLPRVETPGPLFIVYSDLGRAYVDRQRTQRVGQCPQKRLVASLVAKASREQAQQVVSVVIVDQGRRSEQQTKLRVAEADHRDAKARSAPSSESSHSIGPDSCERGCRARPCLQG
jgi:hypothetical protein